MGIAKTDKVLVSFSSGEWEPGLDSRIDLAKAGSACRTLKNFRTDVYGGAIKRPGLRYVGSLKGSEPVPPDITPFAAIAPNLQVYDIDFFNDGGFVAVGDFTVVSGQTYQKVVSGNSSGSLESAYPNVNSQVAFVGVVDGSAAGWFVIAGAFVTVGVDTRQRAAALNRDKTLRASFADPVITGGNVECGAVDSSGRILLGGGFTSVNGAPMQRLVRLLQTGVTDPTWSGIAINGTVRDIVLQDDGKIVIAGDFSIIAGSTRYRLARLNTDGSVDSTFTRPFSSDIGFACVVDASGRIVFGCATGMINGVAGRGKVGRFLSNGDYDNSFEPVVGHVGTTTAANTVAVTDDGIVIAGGGLITTGGVSTPRITAITDAGALSPTWNGGAPTANGNVKRLLIRPGNVVWVVGDFTSINGESRTRIAKLRASTGLVFPTS